MKLESDDQRRWHGCFRKQPFKSAENACTAARHQGMKRGTFTAYHCSYCNLWHITHKNLEVVNPDK